MAAPGRVELVELAGQVVGYSARLNPYQVEAVLCRPDRQSDLALGVFRRRRQAAAAVVSAASGLQTCRQVCKSGVVTR